MIDLPTQIAAAQRELAMRRSVYPHHIERKKLSKEKADAEIANMEAIIRTLEWLYANEEKIRAKVKALTEHDVEPIPETQSASVYRMANAVFLDMARGGWERRYEIIDEAGRVIGTKIEGCETRGS